MIFMVIVSIAGFVVFNNYGMRGSGTSKTESRELEKFERIAIEGFGELIISTGDVQSVSVTTDDNLIKLLETTVENGELTIRQTKTLNPNAGLVIKVVVPKLTHVEVAGAAKLTLANYQGESLDIELAGACGAYGVGTVDRLKLELAGACRARLASLQAKEAVVEISGTGSAVVYASDSLNAEANGFASITCQGNPPDVKKDINGISRVTVEGSQP